MTPSHSTPVRPEGATKMRHHTSMELASNLHLVRGRDPLPCSTHPPSAEGIDGQYSCSTYPSSLYPMPGMHPVSHFGTFFASTGTCFPVPRRASLAKSGYGFTAQDCIEWLRCSCMDRHAPSRAQGLQTRTVLSQRQAGTRSQPHQVDIQSVFEAQNVRVLPLAGPSIPNSSCLPVVPMQLTRPPATPPYICPAQYGIRTRRSAQPNPRCCTLHGLSKQPPQRSLPHQRPRRRLPITHAFPQVTGR